MRRILIAALFLLFIHQTSSAQTENVNAVASKADYSESIPYKPRVFADKKKSKPKKEKESKNDKQAVDNRLITDLPAMTGETVTIPVSVFGSDGKFVRNLTQPDFKVFADGKEQEILSVGRRDEPVNLILLIDVSPSTAYRIEEIQNYALAIVERLNPDDKVMVIEFDENSNVLTELTSDRQIIAKAVRKADFGSGTALYEAVEKTFRKYISGIQGRTTVVLLTDGVDTTSYKSDYANSLLKVEKADAPVFSIYFDTYASTANAMKNSKALPPGILSGGVIGSIRGAAVPGLTTAEYEIGKLYLYDISALSGGRTRVVKNITDTRPENVDNIGGELRLQYQINFKPSGFVDGQRKQVTVRVNRPGLVVQARGSSFAGNQ